MFAAMSAPPATAEISTMTDDGVYNCPACKKQFAARASLELHRANKHSTVGVKRGYSESGGEEQYFTKRACYDGGAAATESEQIVTAFLGAYYSKQKESLTDVMDHLIFECTYVSRKRKHYIGMLLVVLESVHDMHSVNLANVARRLADFWLRQRHFDWDLVILVFAIGGTLYRMRPNLYGGILEMLLFFSAYNRDSIDNFGGWKSILNYSNMNLETDGALGYYNA